VENEPDFTSVLFLAQTASIAIHTSNPLSNRQTLSLSELKDEDFVVISPKESPVGYDRFLQQCADAGFVPHVVRQPRSLESLLLCVEVGMGAALLDPNTRLEHNSNIRTVPIPGSSVNVCVVYRSDAQLPHLEDYVRILTTSPRESYATHPK
jgi:DNA-binding transcriptional LysR family regulator